MKSLRVLTVLISLSATTIHAQTVSDIIQQHNKAIGGDSTWNAVKTVRIEQEKKRAEEPPEDMPEISIRETINYITGRGYSKVTAGFGLYSYDIQTPAMHYKCTTTLNDDEPRNVDSIAIKNPKAARERFRFNDPLMQAIAQKGNAQLAGTELLNGQKTYKLKVTQPGTGTSIYYVAASTGYTLRTVLYDKDAHKNVTTDYSNFKTLPNGMVVPMEERNKELITTINYIHVSFTADERVLQLPRHRENVAMPLNER